MTSPSSPFRKKCLIALSLFPIAAFSQQATQDSIWQPLKYFVGTWTGKGGGEPGIGEYERTYEFFFNKKFIQVKNMSSYPSSNQYPKGEVHRDLGYFSYDNRRHSFVLRQFHIEGFVNQYLLDSISADGKRIVFVSEAIENIRPGWRARESYEILGENEFTETFELAPPNKAFEVYTSVTLHRRK